MSADFVAIGDLHLDKQQLLGMFGNDTWELQLEPVREALNWAVDNGVPNAVFLGDIFHQPKPSLKGMMALVRVMFEFDGKLDMHFMTGNHDVESSDEPDSLALFKRLADQGRFGSVFVHSEPFDDEWGGMPVRICPWGHSDPGGARVCFGHFARPGSVRDNGYQVRGPEHGDRDAVEDPGDGVLWVVGHLHSAQRVRRTYFPGTLYQTNFGEEDGPKSFLRGQARLSNGRTKCKLERIRVKRPFRLGTVRISDDAEWTRRLARTKRQRFRVLHSPELRQPGTYMLDNPAVVECRPSGSPSKSVNLKSELASAEDQLSYGIKDGLDELLTEWGTEPKQVKRANEVVDEIAAELGM